MIIITIVLMILVIILTIVIAVLIVAEVHNTRFRGGHRQELVRNIYTIPRIILTY